MVLAGAAIDAGLDAEPLSTGADALDAIAAITDSDDRAPRILVGGSLYLVGDVLADNGTPPK